MSEPENTLPILTGEEVVSGVATNIRSAFTSTELVAIYKDSPMQNIKKPYAFIHQIHAEHRNEMVGRGEHHFMVDVRVHPSDAQTNVQTWARSVAYRLVEAINVITISSMPVKSRSMEWRVEENVLHFIVSYTFKVITPPHDTPIMETLEYYSETTK